MARVRGYTVFEAVNRLRRMVYVGATRATMHDAIEELRREPSLSFVGWSLDPRSVRSVAFGLSRREAGRLVEERERKSLLAGWTTSVL